MTRNAGVALLIWITFGLGWLILSLAMVIDSWFCYVLGQLILLGGVILIWTGPGTTSDTLSLSEHARSEIGPAGEPEFNILLVDAGSRRMAVLRCLRQLYSVGLRRAWSVTKDTPSVIQIAASRREADFVAARLVECGATVDIVKAQESDNGRALGPR